MRVVRAFERMMWEGATYISTKQAALKQFSIVLLMIDNKCAERGQERKLELWNGSVCVCVHMMKKQG